MSRKNKKNKESTRKIAQVSSKSLIPPEEPTEPTEADVDFDKEEQELEEQTKKLKERRAALNKRKRVEVGGKKLGRMRKFANETVSWAFGAAGRASVSIARANEAVAKLSDYEDKLGLPVKTREGDKLAEQLKTLTEAVEVIDGAKD